VKYTLKNGCYGLKEKEREDTEDAIKRLK